MSKQNAVGFCKELNSITLTALMIEIKGYTLGFHIALLSSAFNEADYSSNYVVIVTAISHRAICVRLCLDSAD